ncbi:rhamnulokinase [Kiritimatiella glycovorans]|uniref:Rhamnulokinase n=1 Tax=Kiritimatiella glycovorans TaxID=1307763 RepID=A0A0G3EEG7_9BACT|nr:rhamnulokinase family protein [Kiritimatiella glycovorans]AKJ64743.1 Rhamnulokinase [Kiritimatiella glycovorans]
MAATRAYLALDIGASSGRALIGRYDGSKLSLEEVHRFDNGPHRVLDTLHWDVLAIFDHIKLGIRAGAAQTSGELVSMGVDTWGVDFGLLDERGHLLANPVNYRDSRTDGMMEAAFQRMPREQIFRETGIQFMKINTLYQMLSLVLANDPVLKVARTFLTIPDLIHYWLTGHAVAERTNASTTQFYNPVEKKWAAGMLREMGLPSSFLPELRNPGTCLGQLLTAVADETGAEGLNVVLPGCHDTASAVAAVPAAGKEFAYLSAGTWSLLGTELDEPVISDEALQANFTNEVGVDDTIRFLKNLSGLWVQQEIRRVWAEAGTKYSWDEIGEMAAKAPAFEIVYDPSHPDFLPPGDMPARIDAYCERTGQTPPSTPGGYIRATLEGLALLYAHLYEDLERITGRTLDTLHIVGGGSQNPLLPQFAADALGRTVVTGPVEATAIGNLLAQMEAMGDIGSIAEGREVVRNSFPTQTLEPGDSAPWREALERFRSLRETA